jgi:signal transduction histidine kinase/ActR/RegA family two-component response regulator
MLGLREQDIAAVDKELARCMYGELVYEPDVRQIALPFPQRFSANGFLSLVIAPLMVETNVFGVLVTARRQEHGFSSTDCEFLKQLSEHVALATHQAQLYTALQQAYDDLRQSQQTVMQQERLRALGEMASGIAHDINNAISPVSLYTELLLEKEPNLSAEARSRLQIMQQAVDDVAGTIARMREFYRPREASLTFSKVDVNRAINQVVELTEPRWRALPEERGIVIELRRDLTDPVPPIAGDEVEVRDALTNLVFNAVDAMPEGGTLILRTRGATGSDGRHEVHVEVCDSGIGMDEEARRRCLEPFFTTKGERGTGLGLASVYGMIQRHNGELEIESAVGKGTTMRMIFSAQTATTATNGGYVPSQVVTRRLRILLVDDDPVLIRSLQDALESDGHQVKSASGGQSGIEAFTAVHGTDNAFAIVITDLGMPRVDGRRVASAIKALSRQTPVIMLTGWGQRLLAENDIPHDVDRVLSKPPRLPQLRAAITELID